MSTRSVPPVPSAPELANLEFAKMSGAGNDFLVMDNRQGQWNFLKDPARVRAICRRGLGVGADGVLLLESSKKAQVRLLHFNSDGSQSDFCGNGTRCAARYALYKVMAGRHLRIETGSQVVEAVVAPDFQVALRLALPAPVLGPFTIKTPGGNFEGYTVNAGVPHLVILTPDPEAVPVSEWSPALRRDPAFGAEGVNVDWIPDESGVEIPIRTFERGVEGETLACGSGAMAAWAVARAAGWTEPERGLRLRTRSGCVLTVAWADNRRDISLEGEARLVYRGRLTREALQE